MCYFDINGVFMKKVLALGLLSLSTVVNAETAPAQQQAATPQPILGLAIFDISNTKEPKRLEHLNVSRSNKNHRLCWTAANVGAMENSANLVIETFLSPTAITLTDDYGVNAQRSKDGKTHILVSSVPTFQDNLVERCWQFPTKYPIGEYKVAVRINNFDFPMQSFKIVR